MELTARLAEETRALCAVPSVCGDEAALADRLETWARRRLPAEQVRRLGNALVLGPEATGDRPRVVLAGHLDTVPPPGGAFPAAEVLGDRVVGLGSSDMKGGVAVALALLEDLDLARLPVALNVVLYDREEGPYDENGLGPVLDALPWLSDTGLALLLEPTDGVVQVGCVGSMHATVTFHGTAAHSARPWLGENAVTRAGALLAELHRRAPEVVTVGGQPFREVFTVTRAEGGRYRNVVPDRFELNLNYRFAPDKDPDAAEARLRALVGEAEVTITDRAPAGAVPAGAPLYEAFLARTGLPVAPKQAWTDVARFTARGVPAVNYGPGVAAQAHQAGEWAPVPPLAEAYRVLRAFLEGPLA